MKTKVFIIILGLFLSAGFFASHFAAAMATVNRAKINGSDEASAIGGGTMRAFVEVSLTNGSSWKSTAYRFGEGEWICVDTPDYLQNGVFSEEFAITAPAKEGTALVRFSAFSGGNCADENLFSAGLIAPFARLPLGAGALNIALLAFLALLICAFALSRFQNRESVEELKTNIGDESDW